MTRPYNVIRINGHIVPATYHDAIKKILVDIEQGRITRHARRQYRKQRGEQTCLCAIGTFFTDDQLDHLNVRGDNRANIRSLAHVDGIGNKNINAMTGMEVYDAQHVQDSFDRSEDMAEFRLGMKYRLSRENYPNPAIAHTGAWHFPVSGE
jgi:hypothetical protein